MAITLLRNPPADAAQAIMVVKYAQGDYRAIFQRLHVNTTDPTTLVAAFDAYKAIVKNFYDSAWDISFSALYHIVAGEPIRYPAPASTSQAGVGGTATAGISSVTRRIYSLDTAAVYPKKAFVKFEAIGGDVPRAPYVVTSASGGTTHEQDLVAFLSDPTFPIRGHDGTELQPSARVLTPLAKRDRAKGMRAA